MLDGGRLQQLASPRELVESPGNEFVDQFLGQHRFQLSLLTRTIRSVLAEVTTEPTPPSATRPRESLNARHSLIEALDMFKKTGQANLPVYDRGRYAGQLAKKDLTSMITRILSEAGTEK